MGKRWTRVLIIIAFIGGVLILIGEEDTFDRRDKESIVESETQNTEIMNDTVNLKNAETEDNTVTSYGNYQFLNADLLGREIICSKWGSLLTQGIYDYSQAVKGEFAPAALNDSGFPEKLVVMMEEIFYNSSNSEMRNSDRSGYYDERLKELGAEKFLLGLEDAYVLFPKIADYKEQIESEPDSYKLIAAYKLIEELYVDASPSWCDGIFHFQRAGGQDNYLFSYVSGNKDPSGHLTLMERRGDEFILIQELYKRISGRPNVVQYGGEFYYVILEDDEYLHTFEGMKLFRLNENPGEDTDTLLFCYLPEQYIWEDVDIDHGIYVSREDWGEIDAYIEDVKKELLYLDEEREESGIPVHYLGFGRNYGVIDTFFGDEKKADVLNLKNCPDVNRWYAGEVDIVYKMDIANCSMPLYISKHRKCYDYTEEYLEVRFIYYDSQTASYEELEQLSYSDGGLSNINLVQMWFKEIQGKIYTCQVYHADEFNYMFQMVLLEGNRSSIVRTAVIAPQRKFVVMEEDE